MKFSCFIFLNVRFCCSAMFVFGKPPVFNILQQSVVKHLDKSGAGTKAPLVSFFYLIFSQLNSYFVVLKQVCFSCVCLINSSFALVK